MAAWYPVTIIAAVKVYLISFFSFCSARPRLVYPRPPVVFGRTRPVEGGGVADSALPLLNLRFSCRSKTGKWAIESSQQLLLWKLIKKYQMSHFHSIEFPFLWCKWIPTKIVVQIQSFFVEATLGPHCSIVYILFLVTIICGAVAPDSPRSTSRALPD